MSDVNITINGGTNAIAPNATKIEQHFYGDRPAGEAPRKEAAGAEGHLPEIEKLSIYVDRNHIDGYLAQIGECRTASELAKVVVAMVEQEPQLTKEEMVKERFISLLLPFAFKITKGATVDNVRQRINDAWANRPRHRQ